MKIDSIENMDEVISVTNLTKSFNDRIAVNNINIKVKRGEIFGFLGPNGSGKTTTLRMLCGLLTPDSGSGSCLGFNVLTESDQIKKNVGYMSQRFSLYDDLSVYENLDFIGQLYQISNRKVKINECIANLNLEWYEDSLAMTLSGGWKQRLALAAALLHSPQLLLLDEPTAGVDPNARHDFWHQLHLLSEQGITTLVSTHYMDEAARCDRLAYILNGNLLVIGNQDEIINSCNLVTWRVTGGDLNALAQELESVVGIEQITQFGNYLHVNGKDKRLLSSAIQSFRSEPYQDYIWEKVSTSLEDAFIMLGNKK